MNKKIALIITLLIIVTVFILLLIGYYRGMDTSTPRATTSDKPSTQTQPTTIDEEGALSIVIHLHDTASNEAVDSIPITLSVLNQQENQWQLLTEDHTQPDGHFVYVPEDIQAQGATYKITLDVASHTSQHGISSVFPYIEIIFNAQVGQPHYYIPIMLSPYGYTTYVRTNDTAFIELFHVL